MKYGNLIFIVLIPLIFNGCHKDYEFQDFDYKTYNRVVGSNGGTLNFYANYENDTKNEIIASLEIPKGALDSLLVFNMYQFENYELATQMEEGFAKFGSKLLYFVPFYESEGYHERGQMELNYHLSITFKKPVKITYHPLASYSDMVLQNWQEVELYNNYYKTTNQAYKVYRIKIPKIDEWGYNNNIFVNWTRQGYPNGYDPIHLSYIVNGKWTASDSWGTGKTSMENWELVGEYQIETAADMISFEIYDTDYIYIVARDIYLNVTNVPINIKNYIIGNFMPDTTVTRASYDESNYKIYLSFNTVAVFDNNQFFQYRYKDNLADYEFPSSALDYIGKNYPGDPIEKLSWIQDAIDVKYQALLSSGIKLYFDANGGPAGSYQYNYNPAFLPTSIYDYIKKNYPGQVISNVTLDNVSNFTYIVYLSSNVKVYFNSDGIWFESLYYNMSSDELPANILNYFSTNYPDAIYSEIEYTKGIQSSFYNISLVDSKWFYFGETGQLWQYEFRNVSEDDLPSAVKTYLNTYYPKSIITNIIHKYSDNTEWYEIYFDDLTNVWVSPNGVGPQG